MKISVRLTAIALLAACSGYVAVPSARSAVISVHVNTLDRIPLAKDPEFAAIPVTVSVFDVTGAAPAFLFNQSVNTVAQPINVPDGNTTAVRLVFTGTGLRTATVDPLSNVVQDITVAMPRAVEATPAQCYVCTPQYYWLAPSWYPVVYGRGIAKRGWCR